MTQPAVQTSSIRLNPARAAHAGDHAGLFAHVGEFFAREPVRGIHRDRLRVRPAQSGQHHASFGPHRRLKPARPRRIPGMPAAEAADLVRCMADRHRLPGALRRAGTLARADLPAATGRQPG